MRERLYQPFLFMLARASEELLRREVEFLKAENEILRSMIPKKAIRLKAKDRDRLLMLGKELGPAIRHIITVVTYSTFRRWVRREEGDASASSKGRPRIDVAIRQFVVRLARDNGWGYSRILGELRKLRIGPISRQSVKNILLEHGIDPGPKRGKGSWSEFLRMHAETLWQVDFFGKLVWTKWGPRQVFALVFLHAGKRRVFATPSTFRPDATWMEQQAQAFLEHADSEHLTCEMLMRDLDRKFSVPFDRVFTDRRIKVKPVGPRAPNMNAYVERWIQSLKHEVLNAFLCFGRQHFDHLVSEFVEYYHDCRPHQGVGNTLLPRPRDALGDANPPEETPVPFAANQIACDSRLGGRLKHYYRRAA